MSPDHRAHYYPGLFAGRYDLRGRDWVRRLEPDDLQVFIELGMSYNLHGRLGGLARAVKATRDSRGRFAKKKED